MKHLFIILTAVFATVPAIAQDVEKRGSSERVTFITDEKGRVWLLLCHKERRQGCLSTSHKHAPCTVWGDCPGRVAHAELETCRKGREGD